MLNSDLLVHNEYLEVILSDVIQI